MSKEEKCSKENDESKTKKCSKENGECDEKKECKNHSEDYHEHHGGRCKELEAKIELLEKQVEENKKLASQYLSTASYYKTQAEDNKKDFERFKERNKNIENEANSKANETVAKKILPVIDNFDQAIAHITDAEIIKGFSMIYSSLISVLADIGVQEIKSKKGDELNPEYHNCISTEDTDDELLDGKISAVYQKGYMFAESKKVIRPATVSVYKK